MTASLNKHNPGVLSHPRKSDAQVSLLVIFSKIFSNRTLNSKKFEGVEEHNCEVNRELLPVDL